MNFREAIRISSRLRFHQQGAVLGIGLKYKITRRPVAFRRLLRYCPDARITLQIDIATIGLEFSHN